MVGIPKTIDNDIPVFFVPQELWDCDNNQPACQIVNQTSKFILMAVVHFLIQVIDKSFGFDTAVEEAQRAINAAHVEAESVENGIGVVKLMGRYSGKITIL